MGLMTIRISNYMKKKGIGGMSLSVIYRACSTGNTAKKKLISKKIDAVQICFNSFIRAFENTEIDLTVLLDKPTNELRDIFKRFKTEETYYSSFTEGNVKSFHRQIDIALQKKQDFLFVEDDYIFLPKSGKIIIDALDELPLITPYLHPGYFSEKIHSYKKDIELVNGRCWMGVTSTTLTFGGKYDSLLKEYKTMKDYGWADHPMFCDITQRIPLYAPTETLATHIEIDFLAPGIDWFANLRQLF